MELVAGDIGGTHARFAIATRSRQGGITLSHEAKLKVADHASLATAFEAYAAGLGRTLPDRASIAVAGPVDSDLIQLTNNPWVIRPALAADRLRLRSVRFVNDFAAVAHAVAVAQPADFTPVAGPAGALPATGVVTVTGAGTGLGVAQLLMGPAPRVIPTEGGHIDYAPLDRLEDQILAELRTRFRRVSVERLASGPGLRNILTALAAIEAKPLPPGDDAALWAAAIAGTDTLAEAALDRWCLAFGAIAGDLALAHGASAVVLAGGIVPRIAALLPQSGFHARFTAKGRFETRMAAIPILRITHPEPGLLGAAAAAMEES
jgi:glucokinase